MKLMQLAAKICNQVFNSQPRRRAAAPWLGTSTEDLESRLVLYAVSGNAWPSPELVTISFQPDGTTRLADPGESRDVSDRSLTLMANQYWVFRSNDPRLLGDQASRRQVRWRRYLAKRR